MQLIGKTVGVRIQNETVGSTGRGLGLARPVFVGNVAALAALTSAGFAGWAPTETLILALVAWIDGLFLTAYLQARDH